MHVRMSGKGNGFVVIIILLLLSTQAGLTQDGSALIDKTTVYYQGDQGISLNGTWIFYPSQFIISAPDAFPVPHQNPFEVEVPAYWTEYIDSEGYGISPKGFASYRKKMVLPKGFRNDIMFSLPVFDDSYRFYINGNLLATNGNPGKDKVSSKPGYKPRMIIYSPQSDTLEFVIEVSNFHHRRGGFWKTIRIGPPLIVDVYAKRYDIISSVSLGVLIAFCLFFFFFYLFYRPARQMIFFSIALAGLIIRFGSTDSFVFLILCDISWFSLIRMEYIGTFIALAAMGWYFHSLYPIRSLRYVHLVNTGISGLACIIILFSEVDFFTYLVYYIYPVSTSVLFLYLMISLFRVVDKDRVQLVYFLALAFLLTALIHDILVANSSSSPYPNYILLFAAQAFILVQAIMLVRMWLRVFIEKEELHAELEYVNENLEKLVKERTAALNDRNLKIGAQNRRINQQNESLQKEIELKNRVFSIIAHDLRNPVSSLLLFFDYIKMKPDSSGNAQLIESSSELVTSLSQMIENLLFWGRSQGKQIRTDPKELWPAKMVNSMKGLFSEATRNKSIDLRIDIPEEISFYGDEQTLMIVFRNLLSNAVKFTERNGIISIKGKICPKRKNCLVLSFEDNGIGMDQQKLQAILEKRTVESSFGTAREKGTGLGLSLCMDLVDLNEGRMKIQSETGKGTLVELELPVKSNES